MYNRFYIKTIFLFITFVAIVFSQKKIIAINNDGFSCFFSGRIQNVSDFNNYICTNLQPGITIVEWGVMCGGTTNYKSKHATMFGSYIEKFNLAGDSAAAFIIGVFARDSINPLKVVISECKKLGIECYVSFRMNPYFHERWSGYTVAQTFNGEFWWNSQSVRVMLPHNNDPRPNLSYGSAKVRNHFLGLIKEVIDYQPDGINLDFLRKPPYFGVEDTMLKIFKDKFHIDGGNIPLDDYRWIEIRKEIMSEFIEDVYRLVNSNSSKHKKKIKISIRIDRNSFEYSGFDIRTWAKKKWVDQIIVGQNTLGGYEFDISQYLVLVQNTPANLIADEEIILHANDKFGASGAQNVEYMPLSIFCQRVKKWYKEGAAGIHIFNAFHNPNYVRVAYDTTFCN